VRGPLERGRVYIVGAGPGDPGLLTLRAAEILRAADCVFYDQLVSAEVMALVRSQARLVGVGHRAGAERREPDAVVAAMAERARQGDLVCRLKGGDPYVFGRGAEETQALRQAGVPYEVVSGVSSAVAGPSAAGIPVTHRGVARSMLVVTGHEPAAWERLRADTVVVLMGLSRLERIAGEMMAAGWPADLPAAVVSQATTPRQRHVVGTLSTIGDCVLEGGIGSPALLVVGRVALMADERQVSEALTSVPPGP
jgi:uroporphyrin-III C-methyltransferase